MRSVIATLIALVAAAEASRAQRPAADFVHDRDYTFERMEATRPVNDEYDKGTLRLVTYVYRPLKDDRHEAVVFSVGSTGGMTRSPKEPGEGVAPAVIRFFVSRGYTFVVPVRRGRGESSGTYVEECAVVAGKCTIAQQLALTERGLREALLDTNAVIDQVVLGRLVPRDSKILLVGQSRGGFLSLILAGERPSLVKGVVNFAGGWQSLQSGLSDADFKERLELQAPRLAKAARQFNGPSIWIYAARDQFYRDDAPRMLLDAWQGAGGQAEYVGITEHSLANAHLALTDEALWGRQVNAFLGRVDKTGNGK
jgi:pimeloyl-ACP methyl ester carboxylesterase